MQSLLLRAVAVVLTCVPGFADVLRVDPADPLAHPTVQSAVDAAVDGDVVLVADGLASPGFTIDGKGLTVAVDGAPGDIGPGRVVVRNVASGSEVDLLGLDARRLELLDCQGTVWIESCRFRLGLSQLLASPPSLVMGNCDEVVLKDTLCHAWSWVVEQDLLRATNSRVFAWNSAFLGAQGGSDWEGIDGADAATLVNSAMFAEGCVVRGNDGTGGLYCEDPFCQGSCDTDGDGGDGLVLDEASNFRSRGNTIAGGGTSGVCGGGEVGLPVESSGGVFVELCGTPRFASTGSTVYEGELLDVTLRGRPGEFVFLLVSESPVRRSLGAPYVSELFLGPGYQVLPAGVLDELGAAVFGYGTPAVHVGEDARVLTLQPVFVRAESGALSLGGPTRTVVLRAGV